MVCASHDRCGGHEWRSVCSGRGDAGLGYCDEPKVERRSRSITYAFAPKHGTLAIFSVDPQKRISNGEPTITPEKIAKSAY